MKLIIKSCMNCGSFLFVKLSLCEKCYQAVVNRFNNPNPILIMGHQVRSLLKWNPGESDLLSRLIHQLKTDQPQLWRKLAYDFIRMRSIDTDKDRILVSIRATSNQTSIQRNHAQNWGEGLSIYSLSTHSIMLAKAVDKAQKVKTIHERKSVSLLPIVDISMLSGKKVVFVDDVVTTGSTLNAAYKALGSPSEFECWSMTIRTGGSIAENTF